MNTTKTKAYAAQSATSPLASATIPRREPTPRDVKIEILYCGICHSDLHYARNEWSSLMQTVYPCVPGHEIVGRVTSVGPSVTKFKPGDLVGVGCLVDADLSCPHCRAGNEQFSPTQIWTYGGTDKHLGLPTYGGYSESIVVDEHFVLRVPQNLPLAGVAPLLCAGITTQTPKIQPERRNLASYFKAFFPRGGTCRGSDPGAGFTDVRGNERDERAYFQRFFGFTVFPAKRQHIPVEVAGIGHLNERADFRLFSAPDLGAVDRDGQDAVIPPMCQPSAAGAGGLTQAVDVFNGHVGFHRRCVHREWHASIIEAAMAPAGWGGHFCGSLADATGERMGSGVVWRVWVSNRTKLGKQQSGFDNQRW